LPAKLANAITGRLTNFAVLQLRHFTVGHGKRGLKTFAASIFSPSVLDDGFGCFSVSQFSDDIDEEAEIELPPTLRKQAETLRAQATRLPNEDPKLEQLLALAKTSHEGDGPGKMLVFSFFLHTLTRALPAR
jgi:hypothetical protein